MLAPAMLSKGTSTDRLQADDLAVVEIPAFKALRFDALCIDKAQIELWSVPEVIASLWVSSLSKRGVLA